MAEELDYGRVERFREPEPVKKSLAGRCSFFNFVCMMIVAAIFDVFGLFLNEIPLVGAAIVILADLIFIPWFYFSGMSFNGKRIGIMAAETVFESIPIVGNLPLITVAVFISYMVEGTGSTN